MNGLSYLRDIPWSEIWNTWKSTEEESWRPFYESRGHDTWESWRKKYLDAIHPEERNWKLYKIIEPERYVPQCFVGPFAGWKQYYRDRNDSRFHDIAQNKLMLENEKVMKMVKKFPGEAFFIGLQNQDRTMFIEGTHRATALTMRAHDGEETDVDARIALTTFSETEQQVFDELFSQIPRVPND